MKGSKFHILCGQLDRLVREYAKLKYLYCVTCGKGEWAILECAHVLTSGRKITRWHPRNITRQCHICNSLHESNPKPLEAWFENIYGEGSLDELKRVHNSIGKLTITDLEALKEYYDNTIRTIMRHGTPAEFVYGN